MFSLRSKIADPTHSEREEANDSSKCKARNSISLSRDNEIAADHEYDVFFFFCDMCVLPVATETSPSRIQVSLSLIMKE
jgi:hypothetical protein